MRSGPGEARTILLLHTLVLYPLNSLLWYVPSSRYIWSSAPLFVSARTNKRHHHQVSPRDRISLLSEIQSACDENLGGGLGFVPPILFITNLLIGTPWRADLRGHLCNGQIKGIIIIIKTFPNLDLFLKEGEGGMLTRLKQLKRS